MSRTHEEAPMNLDQQPHRRVYYALLTTQVPNDDVKAALLTDTEDEANTPAQSTPEIGSEATLARYSDFVSNEHSNDDDVDMAVLEFEMKEAFKKGGMAGVKNFLDDQVDGWEKKNLRIGVTGRAGVGKSTFINTIRGLDAESDGAAAVGGNETTSKLQEYPHPKNRKLILCDLPGVGTSNFSRNTYLTDKRIGFDGYDMFIILTCDRIYEDDVWLAQAAKEKGKVFMFIRTQIDITIAKERKPKPKHFKTNANAEADLLQEARSHLEKELRKEDVFEADGVFLIDGTDLSWKTYDFEALVKSLLVNFTTHKREALIMTLSAKTVALIKANVKALRRRATIVSVFSGVVGAVPVPLLSMVVDVPLIIEEALTYRQRLGLSDKKNKRIAKQFRLPVDILKKRLQLGLCTIVWTQAGLLKALGTIIVLMGIEATSKYVPVIGSAIAVSSSFASTKIILGKLLDIFESDALKMHEYVQLRSRFLRMNSRTSVDTVTM